MLTSTFSQHNSVKIKVEKHILSFFILLMTMNVSGQVKPSESKTSSVPMLRLKMNGLPNYLDETVIYYQTGATDGFDSDYDAYKLAGPNSVPQISQDYNSTLMCINGISPVTSSFSISIKATTNTTGNFTITATDFSFLPIGTCVTLNDLLTGASVNILSGPYVFNLLNTTTSSRFVLAITHYDLPITSLVTQPTCQFVNGGKLKVTGDIAAPWNYIWKDSTGNVIRTSSACNHSDSLINLNCGNYSIEVTSALNSCYSNTANFTINQKVAPIIAFSSPDTIIASIFENFTPTNESLNSDSYSWTFGDGGASNDFEPEYSYSTAGLYQIKLSGTNISGCTDSISKLIKVIDIATLVNHESKENFKLSHTGVNSFLVKAPTEINEMDIYLYNIEGQNIFTQHFENLNGVNHINLNFNQFTQGVYLLNISNQNSSLLSAKLLIE